jgi:SAM-dependent methyltransferase
LAAWPRSGGCGSAICGVSSLSLDYGSSRGLEIDRYYIEKFLAEYADDIHGRVLEIKHSTYTRRYGQDRVTKSDVLHPVEGNPDATIVADLTKADHLPSDCYDAIIFTQTLQVIYDIRTVIATLYRILKPGGVLLATVSGMAQLSLDDFDKWGEYWRFTSLSARLLFEEAFPMGYVTVHPYGNVLAAISFLEGLACEDLKRSELDTRDRSYEVLIARAVKPNKPYEPARAKTAKKLPDGCEPASWRRSSSAITDQRGGGDFLEIACLLKTLPGKWGP